MIFFSADYVFDTLMQPAFWFVDGFTLVLGPIFVTMVIFLTSSVIFVTYWIGLPYYVEHKPYPFLCFLLIIGHYILINIVFHFLAALFTHPGTIPADTVNLAQVSFGLRLCILRNQITQVAAICKKCIQPKPPRTHHCSVCNSCILKMDHHCPWLNNCVGHHNHRHFFLYMVFMVVGCAFLMLLGFEIFWEEFIGNWGVEREPEPGFMVFNKRALIFYVTFMTSGLLLS